MHSIICSVISFATADLYLQEMNTRTKREVDTTTQNTSVKSVRSTEVHLPTLVIFLNCSFGKFSIKFSTVLLRKERIFLDVTSPPNYQMEWSDYLAFSSKLISPCTIMLKDIHVLLLQRMVHKCACSYCGLLGYNF